LWCTIRAREVREVGFVVIVSEVVLKVHSKTIIDSFSE
jgi:hypothetical protein